MERPAIDESLWNNLLLLIEAGEVVPIVGRELLEVGPPERRTHLYSWLAERVAPTLGFTFDPTRATKDPLNEVACQYLAGQGDPRNIYLRVFEQARALPTQGIPAALMQLAAITDFKLFVTTIFDSSLQMAVDTVRFGGKPLTSIHTFAPTKQSDLPTQLGSSAIFHLLGRVSPLQEYVVTEEDALEFVHSLQRNPPERLFTQLYQKDLLVIGCRFPAWLVRSFIRLSRSTRLLRAQGRTVFVVDSGAREDRTLIEFLRTFKAGTEVFEDVTPVTFVDTLHRLWLERRPQQPPAADLQSLPGDGAIFLSYASEDRASADALARALDNAKLDAWFDEAQLMAGDRFMERIQAGISRSRLVVLQLSRNCLTAGFRYFRAEWDYALIRSKGYKTTEAFILPVAIDDVSPDDDGIPMWLRDITWYRLKDASIDGFVELVKRRYIDSQSD